MIDNAHPDEDRCLAEQLALHEWWQIRKAEMRVALARREPFDPPVRELLGADLAARLRALLDEVER